MSKPIVIVSLDSDNTLKTTVVRGDVEVIEVDTTEMTGWEAAVKLSEIGSVEPPLYGAEVLRLETLLNDILESDPDYQDSLDENDDLQDDDDDDDEFDDEDEDDEDLEASLADLRARAAAGVLPCQIEEAAEATSASQAAQSVANAGEHF